MRRITAFFAPYPPEKNPSEIYRWFHKGLGLIYFSALLPLLYQIDGLIGKNGLLPAQELLALSYQDQGPLRSFLQFPSLFHFFPSDLTPVHLGHSRQYGRPAVGGHTPCICGRVTLLDIFSFH